MQVISLGNYYKIYSGENISKKFCNHTVPLHSLQLRIQCRDYCIFMILNSFLYAYKCCLENNYGDCQKLHNERNTLCIFWIRVNPKESSYPLKIKYITLHCSQSELIFCEFLGRPKKKNIIIKKKVFSKKHTFFVDWKLPPLEYT